MPMCLLLSVKYWYVTPVLTQDRIAATFNITERTSKTTLDIKLRASRFGCRQSYVLCIHSARTPSDLKKTPNTSSYYKRLQEATLSYPLVRISTWVRCQDTYWCDYDAIQCIKVFYLQNFHVVVLQHHTHHSILTVCEYVVPLLSL